MSNLKVDSISAYTSGQSVTFSDDIAATGKDIDCSKVDASGDVTLSNSELKVKNSSGDTKAKIQPDGDATFDGNVTVKGVLSADGGIDGDNNALSSIYAMGKFTYAIATGSGAPTVTQSASGCFKVNSSGISGEGTLAGENATPRLAKVTIASGVSSSKKIGCVISVEADGAHVLTDLKEARVYETNTGNGNDTWVKILLPQYTSINSQPAISDGDIFINWMVFKEN